MGGAVSVDHRTEGDVSCRARCWWGCVDKIPKRRESSEEQQDGGFCGHRFIFMYNNVNKNKYFFDAPHLLTKLKPDTPEVGYLCFRG